MKKAVIVIMLAVIFIALVSTLTITLINRKTENEYADKCKEEFTFDYGEEIICVEIKIEDSVYIIDIYGEKNHATYICNNGEIWNYDNQSN